MTDAVRPDYYNKNGLECYDLIEASCGTEGYKGFLVGNIWKYLWRWKDKNGIEDLRKAREYLAKLIQSLE